MHIFISLLSLHLLTIQIYIRARNPQHIPFHQILWYYFSSIFIGLVAFLGFKILGSTDGAPAVERIDFRVEFCVDFLGMIVAFRLEILGSSDGALAVERVDFCVDFWTFEDQWTFCKEGDVISCTFTFTIIENKTHT